MKHIFKQTVFHIPLYFCILALVVTSCAYQDVNSKLDGKYGASEVRDRYLDNPASFGVQFYRDVKPILDSRCVVCHACYDAPCQLKLGSFEGLDRGATKEQVYDGARLFAINPSRLYIDHGDTASWRMHRFHPVLNERKQSMLANKEASVLYRMLSLREKYPLPDEPVLPENSFDFRPERVHQCPTIEEFGSFEKKYPLWSMPYAMPSLSEAEKSTLYEWIKSGSYVSARPELNVSYKKRIDLWENFLNGNSLKEKLMSRYLYEHLFLAHLYFDDMPVGEFFRIVRSSTPPDEPIKIIPTRRPFDSPRVKKVYYRLIREESTISVKQHLPYGIGKKRMNRFKELFLKPDYKVVKLPSYKPKSASNPFVTFSDIPARSRYRFLLDDAQFFIMTFIKGPVCNGQTAINVIEDQFWVLFSSPDSPFMEQEEEFVANQEEYLRLPAGEESNTVILYNWFKYSSLHRKYLTNKRKFNQSLRENGIRPSYSEIWNGDKKNTNAALTIFRHFDAASVVQGLVGDIPKTAWILDYPLFERIYYLLVAGFDVYGNVGHQASTRLYMDFLRMEGEYNFLSYLPPEVRKKERDRWYRGATFLVKEYIDWTEKEEEKLGALNFYGDDPKREFFENISKRLGSALNKKYELSSIPNREIRESVTSLSSQTGSRLQFLPQLSFMRISTSKGEKEVLSLAHNSGLSNVFSPFFEDFRRLPDEDTLTLARGFIGAYPNAFFDLKLEEFGEFSEMLKGMSSEEDYKALQARFGVRRTSADFWNFSDWLHGYYKKIEPVESGLFDYNRFENR
ncbi:MAG TPA: fatty acid cis/trans isomerase [Oligoflexia bacterium]|nr:fatty acid cis/trans isomerase [Oligoflexia bacterium]HMP47061.1 fatty acid cis/trans isomerase [Oligoflexia bacterium]